MGKHMYYVQPQRCTNRASAAFGCTSGSATTRPAADLPELTLVYSSERSWGE